jgi:glycosyltransferase 2 family protein
MGRASPEIASAQPAAVSTKFKGAKTAAGYALAVAALAWVFHDVNLAEVFRGVATIRWDWVAAAVAFDILSYICQGLRWSLLLHPAGRISMWKTTQAVYAGLFTNEVLPLRVGEVLRIYLVRRWLDSGLSVVVSSVLVERFLDAIWLGLTVGITILFVPLPHYLLDAEEILAAIVFCGTAVFVYLVVREERSAPPGDFANARPSGLLSKLVPAFGKLASGLRRIGRSHYLYGALLLSGLLLLCQIVAFWLVMWAYDLRLSFWHGAAVLLIVHLGTAVPSAPSNVGTYQFFVVVGLTLLGVEKSVAAGFSVVVFLVLTAPLWIIGLFAVSRAGLSWRNLRSEVNTMVKQQPSRERVRG